MLQTTGLSNTAKFRLAAAYFLAGKKEVADDILKNLSSKVEDYKELANTYGSSTRDKAMILEVLTLVDKRDLALSVLKDISEELGSNEWCSTQTTAYALLAIAKFTGGNKDDLKEVNFEYKIDSGNLKSIVSSNPVAQEEIEVAYNKARTIAVKNVTKSPIFTRIILEGQPLAGDTTFASNRLNLKISYLLMDGNNLDINQLEQGTDFLAEVTLSHPGSRNEKYLEMELNQIFPSGWEIINTRLLNSQIFTSGDNPNYQDIRDDRVYTYYNLNPKQSKTFRVLLNASYLGKFYLPTVYSQAMYDNTINARIPGRWVEVISSGDK
jgi:uncharacterized protein YfaS (alpha-2-macroglobulin family)